MTKQQAMERWEALEENLPILNKMEAIPYKAKGSTYGTCGIRIDGTPEFVDAVMSHLKELLKGEAVTTRLQLSRNIVDGSGIGKSLPNRTANAECVYIRLAERGGEGAILQGILRSRKRK